MIDSSQKRVTFVSCPLITSASKTMPEDIKSKEQSCLVMVLTKTKMH